MQKRGITLVSTLNDRKVIFCHLPMAAILDLGKLQNLPKVATPATKLNILNGPIQVWNHHKTIHFSWQQGPWIGNWTITHPRLIRGHRMWHGELKLSNSSLAFLGGTQICFAREAYINTAMCICRNLKANGSTTLFWKPSCHWMNA